MGCICSKGVSDGTHMKRKKPSKKPSKWFMASSRKEEVVVNVNSSGNEVTNRFISKEPVLENMDSTLLDQRQKKHAKVQSQNQVTIEPPVLNGGHTHYQISRVFDVSNGVDGAQVAAGWPSWLAAVAGEAIKGWVPRKADSFQKLDKIGQGTYSSVYRARDSETGKVVALKKVRFVNMDPESVRFMAREILVLRRLDHPNIMKLEGLVTSRMSGNLYLVFEYMEHDLAGLVASPNVKFTEPQIKCYMRQLFHGLEHCHSRGVLHRDIKGSNLLIDDNGNLKIGDFGLATFFHNEQPLTSRVVTLWYRPPELLLGATDYGVAVDLWSSGCILAELYAGKPIMPGRTEVEQLHKIFKLCGSPSDEYWQNSKLPHATIFKPQHPYKRCIRGTFKDFSSPTLVLLDALLAVEPENRGSASYALHSEFFTTKPIPCDPSSLPKYPPSKEFDAKVRNDEARRQKGAANGIGHAHESHRKISRESKAVPAPDADAELALSILKRKGLLNPKGNSEQFNPGEDGDTGFRMESYRSGPLGREAKMGSQRQFSSFKNGAVATQKSFQPQGLDQISRFSNSVAVRGSSRFDMRRETTEHWPEERLSSKCNHLNDAESPANRDLSRHLLNGTVSDHNDENKFGQEHAVASPPTKHQIHYSGPLLPLGGNIEEMVKEHERRIQHAVRKARFDKTKSKEIFGNNGQTEFLLPYRISGR